MYGLADCNNFYASCERMFAPDLNGRPVVVLSNNDGCIIARSDEAKALGLKMGDAYFQQAAFLRQNISDFSAYEKVLRFDNRQESIRSRNDNQRQTADEQQEHAGQQSLHGTSRAPEFTPDEDAPYRGDHRSALPQRIRDRGAGFTGGNVAESRT